MKGIRRDPPVQSKTPRRVEPGTVASTTTVDEPGLPPKSTFRPSGLQKAVRTEAPVIQTAFETGAFERDLDKTTGSKARDGNLVTPLFDGVHSFPARNEAIASAKKSIAFQTFVFRGDETGWATAKALAAKAKEGIPVLFIYDAIGSGKAPPEIFQLMRDAGVQLREWGDPKKHPLEINDRWHEKHLIIDGELSIEGGMNISDEYALGGSGQLFFSGGVGKESWRDTDVKVQGPAVGDAMHAFLRNWSTLGSDVPADQLAAFVTHPQPRDGGVSVRVVQHRPIIDGDSNTMALLLKAIDTAQKNITIENAYFVPPPELSKALIAAAKRGVDVRVVTNSESTHDNMPVYYASRHFYDELLTAGVKIYEKKGGTIHAKTATFDGIYSLIGSANLNGRSKGRDTEVVVAIKDRMTAQQMEERFQSVLPPGSEEITLDTLKNQSVRTQLKQWAWSSLAWML